MYEPIVYVDAVPVTVFVSCPLTPNLTVDASEFAVSHVIVIDAGSDPSDSQNCSGPPAAVLGRSRNSAWKFSIETALLCADAPATKRERSASILV